jgi:hypothetical protein
MVQDHLQVLLTLLLDSIRITVQAIGITALLPCLTAVPHHCMDSAVTRQRGSNR